LESEKFWDARYREQPKSWGVDPNIFLSQIDLQGLSSSVDLAGGNGRNSLWLADQGLKAENVDISSVALEQFLERAEQRDISDKCLATQSDATTAKFQLTPELLVIAYLQIPASEFAKAFHNALAQVADGAKVFGVWHAVENLEDGYGGPPSKDVLVSKDQLEQLASEHSWKQLKIENRNREINTEDGVKIAIDVVLEGTLSS